MLAGDIEAPLLDLGAEVKGVLRSPEKVSYRVRLRVDDYLHLDVDQQGVDVIVAILDPTGRRRLVVDGPNGTRGTESVWFQANRAGEFQIEVQAGDGAGTYRLHLVSLHPATEEDQLRAAAAAALAKGDALRTAGGAEQIQATEESYLKAIELWEKLKEPSQAAVAWVRVGQLHGARGDRRRQIESFEAALRALAGNGHAAQKSYALLRLGTVRSQELDPEAALAAFEEALRFAQEVNDRAQEATALNNLAILYEMGGALERAAELFGQAMFRYGEMGREDWLAHATTSQAVSYLLMGRLGKARELLMAADELYRHVHDDSGRANVLIHLGWIAYLKQDWQRALERYQEALQLSRSAAHLGWQASALDRRGTLYRVQGRTDKARADFEAARAIFRDLNRPLYLAHTEANLGWLALDTGDLEQASRLRTSALRGFRAAADSHGEAAALYLGARISRRRGNSVEALEHIEAVLRIVESQRQAAQDETVRIAYLNLRFEYFEFYVDLLMTLAEQQPGTGYAARALGAIERSRARSLLDQLTTSGVALQAPAPVDLSQIQKELLEPGTVLVAYSLGRERSFVWAVTSQSLTWRTLPAASEIETLATGLHRALSHGRSEGAQMQAALTAQALSDRILAPIAEALEAAERIVVVGDGALHLVPFGALPSPADGQVLLHRHEVVSIPSASVIIALRRKEKRDAVGIAVLADPPFTVSDPRVSRTGSAPIAATGFVELDRLPYSRTEAEMILALAPAEEPALGALGLEAQRNLVTGGALDDYRILHFATHGLLHSEHPELSGIALSMFDRQGAPTDGTLRVRDIYDLDLNAELVVLSACQTALGERFQGEGVLGFPRAFILAGVPRVVVSLWKVEDRATAELMSRFYDGVLVGRLPPATALTQAQRALAADPAWQSPHDWAAFVLQGDWR